MKSGGPCSGGGPRMGGRTHVLARVALESSGDATTAANISDDSMLMSCVVNTGGCSPCGSNAPQHSSTRFS